MSSGAIWEMVTNPDDSSITVLGMGYIGLPTALGMAELGRRVIGADTDADKMTLIRAGQTPCSEPGVSDLLAKHLRTGRFQPMQDMDAAVRAGTVIFICVGTPPREDGQADLSQVEAVAQVVARNLNRYKLIVEKSTVPVFTGEWLKRTICRYHQVALSGESSRALAESPCAAVIDVASNPEFMREGQALEDFFHPARIICGVESERAREILAALYRPLDRPMIFTDLATAELVKQAANAFLATKVSFINMLADLCEKTGADVTVASRALGLDPRIGPQFLEAGIGFGGACLPKDLRAFVHLAEEQGADFSLLKEVERINRRRVQVFVSKVHGALWVLEGKTVGVLGLAFKPNTDDVRDSVSLKIAKALLEEGCRLRLYDPEAGPNARKELPETPGKVAYCGSALEVASGAHALLLLTGWEEFRRLEWGELKRRMALPILIDGRNFFDPAALRAAGFEYFSIGRP